MIKEPKLLNDTQAIALAEHAREMLKRGDFKSVPTRSELALYTTKTRIARNILSRLEFIAIELTDLDNIREESLQEDYTALVELLNRIQPTKKPVEQKPVEQKPVEQNDDFDTFKLVLAILFIAGLVAMFGVA